MPAAAHEHSEEALYQVRVGGDERSELVVGQSQAHRRLCRRIVSGIARPSRICSNPSAAGGTM